MPPTCWCNSRIWICTSKSVQFPTPLFHQTCMDINNQGYSQQFPGHLTLLLISNMFSMTGKSVRSISWCSKMCENPEILLMSKLVSKVPPLLDFDWLVNESNYKCDFCWGHKRLEKFLVHFRIISWKSNSWDLGIFVTVFFSCSYQLERSFQNNLGWNNMIKCKFNCVSWVTCKQFQAHLLIHGFTRQLRFHRNHICLGI